MKLEVLLINQEALKKLSKMQLIDAQLAWDLSTEIDIANKIIAKFNEKRDALVKRLGEAVKDQPEVFQIEPEKVAEFNTEIDKLTAVQVKVKFPTVKLGQLKGQEITPAEISSLRELNILIK